MKFSYKLTNENKRTYKDIKNHTLSEEDNIQDGCKQRFYNKKSKKWRC